MKKSDFDRFSKLMLATAEALDKDLTPQRVLIYFNDLMRFDIEALEFAAQAHRRTSNFFPKVAELQSLAKMWRAPALPGGQGVKQLESPEMTEARRQQNLANIRKLLDGFQTLDKNYGTSLSKNEQALRRRMEVLEAQKREILQGGQ